MESCCNPQSSPGRAGGLGGASTARLQGPVLGGEGFLQAPRGSFALMLRLEP